LVRNKKPYETIPFVTPTLAGGLGNQMFEIAAAASLAKKNNAVLLVNPNEHILPNQGRNVNNYRSNIFSNIVFDKLNAFEYVYKREVCTYEEIPYKPNIKLMGHFQSWKYFDDNREYIQRLFSPSNRDWSMVHKTAIQVRRGDYYKFPDHHPQLLPEYFHTAAKMANATEVDIYTDDVAWCKSNLKFDVPANYPANQAGASRVCAERRGRGWSPSQVPLRKRRLCWRCCTRPGMRASSCWREG
jgi:hypothetical protein